MSAANKVSLKRFHSVDTAVNADAESTQMVPNLNDECLVEIFQLLPVKKRIWLERICRHWKDDLIPQSFANIKCLEMPHKSYLWYGRYGGQSAILESLVDRIGPHITSVDFTYPLDEQFGRLDLHLLVSKSPKLTKIVCDTNTFSSLAIRNFGQLLGQIESLQVDYRGAGAAVADYERSLEVGLSSMANLKHLGVSYSGLQGTFLRSVPTSLLSVNFSMKNLEQIHLERFLSTHTGLKRLQIFFSCGDSGHRIAQQMPNMLARYCPQLTYLGSSGFDHYSSPTARAFANAIRSLTQLKELDVRGNVNFTDAALKNVCRYCPDLESLSVGDDHNNDHLSLEGLMSIGSLQKLKRLEIVRRCGVQVDDEFIGVLCAGSGATLEQLSFSSKNVTDASLRLMGIECGSLAKLDVRYCPQLTLTGLIHFVKAISNDPSWTDPTKNRRLHITVGLAKSFQNGVDTINEVVHPGRLVVTNIYNNRSVVFSDGDVDGSSDDDD